MSDELQEKGLKIRNEVFRDIELAPPSEVAPDDFDAPFREMVTKVHWGMAWGRETLDRKTRSLLNIAVLMTRRQENEFKVHVLGALNNGATKEEIREVLLQTAVLAGIPLGQLAFKWAKEVLGDKI